jgi:hypothetical protein
MNNYDLFVYIINYYEWKMGIIYDFITWPYTLAVLAFGRNEV